MSDGKHIEFIHPTELVNKASDKVEIAQMLNKRHADGWILDKIIDHAIPTKNAHGQYVIYYFRNLVLP
jgi:hypothetical protein